MNRPEVWDIKDKAPVVVPELPEIVDEASNEAALAIITKMPMPLQMRYMRACQTVEAIRVAIAREFFILHDLD